MAASPGGAAEGWRAAGSGCCPPSHWDALLHGPVAAPHSSAPLSAAKRGAELPPRFLGVGSVFPYTAPACGAARVPVPSPRGRGAHRSLNSCRGSYDPSLSPKPPSVEGNRGPETAQDFSSALVDARGSASLVILTGCHLPITPLD